MRAHYTSSHKQWCRCRESPHYRNADRKQGPPTSTNEANVSIATLVPEAPSLGETQARVDTINAETSTTESVRDAPPPPEDTSKVADWRCPAVSLCDLFAAHMLRRIS